MKKLFPFLILLMVASNGVGDVYVQGYYRQDGTYVRPHHRSNPDGDFSNNWSTYPNVNSYTGNVGTKRTPSYPYGETYGESYFDNYSDISSNGTNRYYQSDDDGTSYWIRLLFVMMIATLYFSKNTKKKDVNLTPTRDRQ